MVIHENVGVRLGNLQINRVRSGNGVFLLKLLFRKKKGPDALIYWDGFDKEREDP